MAKVVIKNGAEEHWNKVIESKLQVVLGSALVQVTRIDIALDSLLDHRTGKTTYICALSVRENSGQRQTFHNTQTDANFAIDGAMARARRSLVRRSRSRASA